MLRWLRQTVEGPGGARGTRVVGTAACHRRRGRRGLPQREAVGLEAPSACHGAFLAAVACSLFVEDNYEKIAVPTAPSSPLEHAGWYGEVHRAVPDQSKPIRDTGRPWLARPGGFTTIYMALLTAQLTRRSVYRADSHRRKRKLLCSRPPARPRSLSVRPRQGVLARPADYKPLR